MNLYEVILSVIENEEDLAWSTGDSGWMKAEDLAQKIAQKIVVKQESEKLEVK